MGKTVAALALAATLTGGWVGGASAAPIKITITGTVSDGYAQFFDYPTGRTYFDGSLTGKEFISISMFDTKDYNGAYVYPQGRSFFQVKGVFGDNLNLNVVYFGDEQQIIIADQVFDATDPNSVMGVSNLTFGFADSRFEQLGLQTGTVDNPEPTTFTGYESTYSANGIFLNNGFYGRADAELSVSSISISTVPLPASAPLFGAAILALGALSYRVKARKAA